MVDLHPARACALLLTSILLLSGCSALLARHGQHEALLQPNTPRSTILAKLGPPLETQRDPRGWTKGKCLSDTYQLKGKISDAQLENLYITTDSWTVYLSELIFTPVELVRSSMAALSEHRLSITYCGDGDDAGLQYVGHSVD